MELTKKFDLEMTVYSNKIWMTLSVGLALITGYLVFKNPMIYSGALVSLFFALLILKKPLIGLIVSLPLILYLSYIDIIWVSPWNYFLVGLGGLSIAIYYIRSNDTSNMSLKEKVGLSFYTRKIYLASFLFLIWMTIINLIQGGALILSFKFIPLLLIPFCVMTLISKLNDLKLFIYCIIVFMSISAFIGIMQFLQIDFFWRLREMLPTEEPVIALQLEQRQRIAGLAYFNIPFSYQLASVTPLNFAILLSKDKKKSIELFFLIFSFSICFIASILSYSKSLLIGLTVALIWVIMNSSISKRNRNVFLLLLFSTFVLIFLCYIFYMDIYDESESNLVKVNSSNLSRLPLFWAGLRVFFENPWGIGAGNFNLYAEKFYWQLRNMPGADHVLETSTHNQFLNALVYYGILGLCLITAFYYYILKGTMGIFRSSPNDYIKVLALGLLACFFSYLIHSMFHNAGPFAIDPFSWYFVGIAMLLMNIYSSDLAKK